MGFLSDFGKFLVSDLEKIQSRREEYNKKYESYSDNELLKRFKTGTTAERLAIKDILRRRGYDV